MHISSTHTPAADLLSDCCLVCLLRNCRSTLFLQRFHRRLARSKVHGSDPPCEYILYCLGLRTSSRNAIADFGVYASRAPTPCRTDRVTFLTFFFPSAVVCSFFIRAQCNVRFRVLARPYGITRFVYKNVFRTCYYCCYYTGTTSLACAATPFLGRNSLERF